MATRVSTETRSSTVDSIIDHILQLSPDAEFRDSIKEMLNQKLKEDSDEGRELKRIVSHPALQASTVKAVDNDSKNKFISILLDIIKNAFASGVLMRNALYRKSDDEHMFRTRWRTAEEKIKSMQREMDRTIEETKKAEQELRVKLEKESQARQAESRKEQYPPHGTIPCLSNGFADLIDKLWK